MSTIESQTLPPPIATITENLVAAAVVCPLAVAGLLAYILFIRIVCKSKGDFKNSYFTLVLCLAAVDCTILSLFALYFPIATVLQSYPFGDSFDGYLGAFHALCWNVSLGLVVSIAFNRYFAICRFGTFAQLYSAFRVRLNVSLVVVVSASFSAPLLFECCALRFFYRSYCWSFDNAAPGTLPLIVLSQASSFSAFACLAWCYASIFAKYRRSSRAVAPYNQDGRQRAEQTRAELKLAVQFFGVVIFLVVYSFTFTVIHSLSTFRWHLFVISFMGVVNHSVNPIIYFCMSQKLRDRLRAGLCKDAVAS